MDKLSPNAFKSVIDIDVLGSYNTLKAVLPDLIRSAKANVNDGKSCKSKSPISILFRSAFVSVSIVLPPTLIDCSKHGNRRPYNLRQRYLALYWKYTLADARLRRQIGCRFFVCGYRHRTRTQRSDVECNCAWYATLTLFRIQSVCSLELGSDLGLTKEIKGPIGGTEGMERLASSSASSKRAQGSTVPLGRFGAVREIADATVYLFSAAGNYVNGEVLVVDGGSWRLSSGSGVGGGFV